MEYLNVSIKPSEEKSSVHFSEKLTREDIEYVARQDAKGFVGAAHRIQAASGNNINISTFSRSSAMDNAEETLFKAISKDYRDEEQKKLILEFGKSFSVLASGDAKPKYPTLEIEITPQNIERAIKIMNQIAQKPRRHNYSSEGREQLGREMLGELQSGLEPLANKKVKIASAGKGRLGFLGL